MKILTLDQLPQGGFAGLSEKRVVTDKRVFGPYKHPAASNGMGSFVYLADANFHPYGETGMHPHSEIDVISVMAKGRVEHQGSLAHGEGLSQGQVQVQRAGGEGFSHNEVNPDSVPNQMIQIWALPEQSGERAGYKLYTPQVNQRTRIYGGSREQTETFYSQTIIEIVEAEQGYTTVQAGEVMVYLSKGRAEVNGVAIEAGTLVSTDGIEFAATSDAQLILFYVEGK